jgi:hypothetical protein
MCAASRRKKNLTADDAGQTDSRAEALFLDQFHLWDQW